MTWTALRARLRRTRALWVSGTCAVVAAGGVVATTLNAAPAPSPNLAAYQATDAPAAAKVRATWRATAAPRPTYEVDSSQLKPGQPTNSARLPANCGTQTKANNRYSVCGVLDYHWEKISCNTTTRQCTVLGTIDIVDSILGLGGTGDARSPRTVQILHHLQITADRDGRTAVLDIGTGCRVLTRGGQCQNNGMAWESRPLSDWQANPVTSVQLVSDDTLGPAGDPEKKVEAMATIHIHADSPTTQPAGAIVVQSPSVDVDYPFKIRFDSASGFPGVAKAALFSDVAPIWKINGNDPDIDQSAEHIYDALYNSNRTFPAQAGGGKRIPGAGRDASDFLTRNSPLENINRRAACSNDRAYLATVPVAANLQGQAPSCDEFPFATTGQGAAATAGTATPRYSVRMIGRNDNSTLGGLLGQLYTSQHLLNGDSFAVRPYNINPAHVIPALPRLS